MSLKIINTLRISTIACMALLMACSQSPSGPSPTELKPVVLVSISPYAYFVERIAGDLVQTEVLIPAGANHELHEPSLTQLKAVAHAALLIKVGHPAFTFENTWLPTLLKDNPNLKVVDTSQGLPMTGDDPHIWVVPANVRVMIQAISSGLTQLLPLHRDILADRTQILTAEIDALDDKIRQTLADKKRARFLVYHPAWGLWARAYGLEQVAIEQSGKEVDPRALSAILEQARADGIKTLFVEAQRHEKGAEVIARELGGKIVTLDPVAHDWMVAQRNATMAIAKALKE